MSMMTKEIQYYPPTGNATPSKYEDTFLSVTLWRQFHMKQWLPTGQSAFFCCLICTLWQITPICTACFLFAYHKGLVSAVNYR